MTSAATPEALTDHRALRKAILAAIPVNVPLRGRYATAIMEQAVGPVLAEAASLRAENEKLKQEIADTRTELDALIQEVLKNG